MIGGATQQGLFNVVNVYDNCPPFQQKDIARFYENTGLDPVSLAKVMHENLHDLQGLREELVQKAGGFDWSCEEENICERLLPLLSLLLVTVAVAGASACACAHSCCWPLSLAPAARCWRLLRDIDLRMDSLIQNVWERSRY